MGQKSTRDFCIIKRGENNMAKRKACKTTGVRYREHSTRKHGVRKDRYYIIRYSVNGRPKEEGLGWASDGWTEAKATGVRAELMENQRRGEGALTLGDKREQNKRQIAQQRAEGLTLAEFWEDDYIHSLKARIKPTSWEKEVAHYTKRICPVIGHKPINKITSEDVDCMLDRAREAGLSPRTQKYVVGTLYRIWKHAAKRKLVKAGDNPAMGVSLPKENNARLRVLTPQNLKDILAQLSVTDPSAHDITLFCALSGCRFSEAARLTWEHVDMHQGTAVFVDTKNKDSRAVYLVPDILSMLERRGQGGTGEYVFSMRGGGPFKQPPFAFKTTVKNLDLNEDRGPRDKVTFHTLRHTAATMVAKRGTPVKDMQDMFGWKTPSMVFRYVKGNEDTQRSAMQGLAHSLSAEPAKVIPMTKKK